MRKREQVSEKQRTCECGRENRSVRKRKKEKTNGLVGAKNRGGAGQTKEKRENKRISRGLKRWMGSANLRKKRKQMD